MLDRKTGATAAGGGGVRIDDAERGADQVVDKIDLGPREEGHRSGVDQYHRILTFNNQIVLGLGVLDIELVMKSGAASALD